MSAMKDLDTVPFDVDRVEALQRDRLLKRVVAPNVESEYGRRHDFASIVSPADYRRAAPLVDYEDLRGPIERMAGGEAGVLVTEPVRYFFVTSGSSGDPKLVPVTRSLIADKSRAFSAYWQSIYRRHPGVRTGTIVTNFSDSGGGNELTAGGIPAGSESAFWSSWTSGLRRAGRYPISSEISGIRDVEARYYSIARVLLEEDVSVLMALNPSTIELLLQEMSRFADSLIADVERGGATGELDFGAEARDCMARRYPANPERADGLRALLRDEPPRLPASGVWPRLAVVSSWRSPMLGPYLRLLDAHLGDTVARCDYISMASEGILNLPIRDRVSGGVLAADTHFYEFIPEETAEEREPDTLLAHELETDRNYVVVLSTSAGLYRYNIGDVVRVTGFVGATPWIEFQHRFGATSSLTGEKLTEAQVVEAMTAAAATLDLSPADFTLFPAERPYPHYVVLVELAAGTDPSRARLLREAFDRELARFNVEYRSKRESRRLGAPSVWVVQPGSYAGWKQRRIAAGANDVQLKRIHLTRDDRFHLQFQIAVRHDAD